MGSVAGRGSRRGSCNGRCPRSSPSLTERTVTCLDCVLVHGALDNVNLTPPTLGTCSAAASLVNQHMALANQRVGRRTRTNERTGGLATANGRRDNRS